MARFSPYAGAALQPGGPEIMISVVVPVHDEEGSLEELSRQIAAVGTVDGHAIEVIFVDDGSRDDSWNVIEQLSQTHGVTGVRLRRNFGKAAALMAGIGHAKGDFIITMDADLQDDPAEIPQLYQALQAGGPIGKKGRVAPFDIISGWKKDRHDPWHKVFPSRVFNGMVSWLTGVHLHDHNCGLKIYRAEVFREVRLYGELHRFVPVLAGARGFRTGEMVVRHRPRTSGSSKYGFTRFFKGFIDLLTVKFLTGFGGRPKHLLGGLGLAIMAFGMIALMWLGGIWIARIFDPNLGDPLHKRPMLVLAVTAVLVGVQLVSLGLLAELLVFTRNQPPLPYSVQQTTGSDETIVPPPASL
jgi:dolichol-phosphate mannosyltransferase